MREFCLRFTTDGCGCVELFDFQVFGPFSPRMCCRGLVSSGLRNCLDPCCACQAKFASLFSLSSLSSLSSPPAFLSSLFLSLSHSLAALLLRRRGLGPAGAQGAAGCKPLAGGSPQATPLACTAQPDSHVSRGRERERDGERERE